MNAHGATVYYWKTRTDGPDRGGSAGGGGPGGVGGRGGGAFPSSRTCSSDSFNYIGYRSASHRWNLSAKSIPSHPYTLASGSFRSNYLTYAAASACNRRTASTTSRRSLAWAAAAARRRRRRGESGASARGPLS